MSKTNPSDHAAEAATWAATAVRGGVAKYLRDHEAGATFDELASGFNAHRSLVELVVAGLVDDGHAAIGDGERVVAVTA